MNRLPIGHPARVIGMDSASMIVGSEWLMGWSISWTDLKQSATDKYRLWLRLHGGF